MLNALLVGNPTSGAGQRLRGLTLPGRWIEPWHLTPVDVADADLVALFGGDGTMQITLSQILRGLTPATLPPLAILPFGTTNMNAGDLNRRQARKSTVQSLRNAIETGHFETAERRMLTVTTLERVEHGFFFGLGVIASVIERLSEGRKSAAMINQLRSFWAMVTGLTSTSATSSELVLNDEAHSVYGLMATTLDRLLFGSHPYWVGAESGDLRLTWVESNAAHLIRHAPALLRGNPRLAREPGFESWSGERATLQFDGPYTIDGEIFHSAGETLTISRSDPLRWIRL